MKFIFLVATSLVWNILPAKNLLLKIDHMGSFFVSIHVEEIFSMMDNVLAEDCNRLRASLYWSFNSLNVLFSCLDAKYIGYKPQFQVLSTNVPTW
jgi:hypothetical protein